MREPSLAAAQVHHPFPPDRFLPYLTTEDVRALDKDRAAVVLVIGAVEQHGPHLPTGTDLALGVSMLTLALERNLSADALQRACAMIGKRLQRIEVGLGIGLRRVALDGEDANDGIAGTNWNEHQGSGRAIGIAAADMLHVIDVDGLTFGRWETTDEPVADVRNVN